MKRKMVYDLPSFSSAFFCSSSNPRWASPAVATKSPWPLAVGQPLRRRTSPSLGFLQKSQVWCSLAQPGSHVHSEGIVPSGPAQGPWPQLRSRQVGEPQMTEVK